MWNTFPSVDNWFKNSTKMIQNQWLIGFPPVGKEVATPFASDR
jgi:hypothetical protein